MIQRLALAVWCVAALFGASPDKALGQHHPTLPAGVRLVLSRCDKIVDRKSLLDQTRVELLSIGVAQIDVVDPESGHSGRGNKGSDRSASLHVYYPECHENGGLVNLRVSDRASGKYTERALAVSDVVPTARPRAVALAIVELLRSSWLDLTGQADGDVREDPGTGALSQTGTRTLSLPKGHGGAGHDTSELEQPDEREIEAARAEAARDEAAREQRWNRKRLEWLGGGRIFPWGDSGDVSTTFSLSLALNRRLRLQVGALVAGGGINSRDIDVHTFEGAGRLALSVAGGSDPEIEVLPAVEVGSARLSGADTADFSRVLAIGSLNATIRSRVTKGVDALVGVQTGYVFTPVEVKSKDGKSLGGFVGAVIGVSVGLAGIL